MGSEKVEITIIKLAMTVVLCFTFYKCIQLVSNKISRPTIKIAVPTDCAKMMGEKFKYPIGSHKCKGMMTAQWVDD
jgi:large-conductance mechanosensitive channel